MSSSQPTAAVVLVAAGRSSRMQAAGEVPAQRRRKPWLELDGVSVIERSLQALCAAPAVREVVVVAHPDDIEAFQRACAEQEAWGRVVAVVPGGEERADSVRLGAFWCSFDLDVIAVHDAARPLVRPELVQRACEVAAGEGAALLVAPVVDTIKQSGDGTRADETLDRSKLWAAQTPQVFQTKPFKGLVSRAQSEGFSPTDDAALWERYIGGVHLVESDRSNLKVTTPIDLVLAEAVLAERARTTEEVG